MPNNQPKPDDRSDNASKLKRAIAATHSNMEAAKETIAETDNPKTKADLEAKNERRAQAIDDMAAEMRQEAKFDKKRVK